MKALQLLILLGALTPGAAIGEPGSYLEGGAFIVHYVPELGFSSDPPAEGWCAAYDGFRITACEEQTTRIDFIGSLPVSWFVLAAWVEGDKEWCGCEFGFGVYDSQLLAVSEHGPCYPDIGMELPTGGWPGPSEFPSQNP